MVLVVQYMVRSLWYLIHKGLAKVKSSTCLDKAEGSFDMVISQVYHRELSGIVRNLISSTSSLLGHILYCVG